MSKMQLDAEDFVENIRNSNLNIYSPIKVGDIKYWIPSPELEKLLDTGFRGISLAGLPLRTRSKLVKELTCRILGYPVPSSFTKTQPRFPGQLFDTYAQKSNNLQVWNEELSPSRRYVILRVSASDEVTRVKVVTGDTLAKLDTTGTLTSKYQARCIPGSEPAELVSSRDTDVIAQATNPLVDLKQVATPVSQPASGELLPIKTIFDRLLPLIGQRFADAGVDQERNRGAALHRLICRALGYNSYQDDGQFPDVRHQILEVKLQTSPTVDLGLASPDSTEPLDVPMINGNQISHRDVRYAICYARIEKGDVLLTNLFISTGAEFFSRFPQFQGRRINSKLQIPLPANFFDR